MQRHRAHQANLLSPIISHAIAALAIDKPAQTNMITRNP